MERPKDYGTMVAPQASVEGADGSSGPAPRLISWWMGLALQINLTIGTGIFGLLRPACLPTALAANPSVGGCCLTDPICQE